MTRCAPADCGYWDERSPIGATGSSAVVQTHGREDLPPSERLATRLGAQDLAITLPDGPIGPFGTPIRMLSIPSFWLGDIDLGNDVEPCIDMIAQGRLTFRIQSEVFRYDHFCLRRGRTMAGNIAAFNLLTEPLIRIRRAGSGEGYSFRTLRSTNGRQRRRGRTQATSKAGTACDAGSGRRDGLVVGQ